MIDDGDVQPGGKMFLGVHGRSAESSTYFLAQRIFLAWLGVTYLMAFASLGVQATGLYGARGILPISDYLQAAEKVLGPKSYSLLPSLLWFNSSNFALQLLCWGGALLSLALIFGIAVFPVSILLWLFYLSFVTVGQEFLSFQWDTLLLETGFLAIFIAPLHLRFKSSPASGPPFIFVLLIRWLLFRLIFLSGLVKLASGDLSWRNWTALTFHYETQPLPTWIGWYVHQLPAVFHKFSTGVLFFVELLVPFLIYLRRRAPLLAAAAITGLQILIALTGNYCFFNFLTIGLCFWLIDDSSWPSVFRSKISKMDTLPPNTILSSFGTGFKTLAAVIIFMLAFIKIPPLEPFHLVSHYGLFAVMTTERPEIIIEGSNDGVEWLAYEFRYKPGDPKKKPAFAEPHQPRLDWQMWFAALGDYHSNHWLLKFCERLLKGSPEVLALLESNPFKGHPPKYIRAVVYDYRFSNLSQKRRDGVWWVRERKGLYCPMLQLGPRR